MLNTFIAQPNRATLHDRLRDQPARRAHPTPGKAVCRIYGTQLASTIRSWCCRANRPQSPQLLQLRRPRQWIGCGGRCPTPSAMAGHLSTKMSDQLVVITCPFRRLHATARRRGRARRLIIAEGETCDAPVTAGRATTGTAIGATPLSNVVKLISERDWAGACCRISKE